MTSSFSFSPWVLPAYVHVPDAALHQPAGTTGGGRGGEGGKRQTPSPVTIYCVHYLLKVAMMSIGFARFPVVEAGCAMT